MDVATVEKPGENPLLHNPCPYGIISAMNKIVGKLETKASGWTGITPEQLKFLEKIYTPHGHEAITIPEIETIASMSADEINQFLADRGFTIKLDPITDPHGFGVASVLDVLEQFRFYGEKGKHIVISRETGVEHPAVIMQEPGLSAVRHPSFDKPLFFLSTVGGDQILLVEAEYAEAQELISTALVGTQDTMVFDAWKGITSVKFPMVDYRAEANITLLKGMEIFGRDGQKYFVTQALQQNRLRLNRFGCRAQSATAVAMTRGFLPPIEPSYTIDGSFSLMVLRNGLLLPLFGIYVPEEHWDDPGDIT